MSKLDRPSDWQIARHGALLAVHLFAAVMLPLFMMTAAINIYGADAAYMDRFFDGGIDVLTIIIGWPAMGISAFRWWRS